MTIVLSAFGGLVIGVLIAWLIVDYSLETANSSHNNAVGSLKSHVLPTAR